WGVYSSLGSSSVPGIFEIIFLVQVSSGARIPSVVYTCDLAIVGASALPGIAELLNILVARLSALVVTHHQNGMIGRACAGREIARSRLVQCQTGIAEGVDHPQGCHCSPAIAVAHHHRDAHRATVLEHAVLVEIIVVIIFNISLGHAISPICHSWFCFLRASLLPRPVLTAAKGINPRG